MTRPVESVVILGATSDIAQAIAYQFASKGYHLLLASRRTDLLTPLQKEIELVHGVSVLLSPFEAGDIDNHSSIWNEWQKELGQIAFVVSAIGYMGEPEETFRNTRELTNVIAANYSGCVSILNQAANYFRQRGQGTIIGITSVAGDRGRGSNLFYGSAKAGFTAYLSGLRNFLSSQGVHVLTVKPGFVNTKMTEGLKLNPFLTAEPESIAKAIVKAAIKKKNTIYYLPVWRWIMLVIRLIPESIFKKLNL